MDIQQALDHIAENGAGVLATLQPDGRPHVSVVFAVPVDGRLWISATRDRIKTRNIRRDGRVVFTSGIRPWAAIDGHASLHDSDDVLEKLRRYYRTARGEHPDWDDYDRAMIAERRLVIEITPARAYGS